jgi:hypothetical protein
MSTTRDSVAAYRDLIGRWARALSTGDHKVVSPFVTDDLAIDRLKMFTDGNFEKRFLKIRDQVEDLLEVFDELERSIMNYIRTQPLAAYDTGPGDSAVFLDWLVETNNPTAEQLDYITCQKCRTELDGLGELNRVGHGRFQELRSQNDVLLSELDTNPQIWIHLNPIRTATTFHTRALLDEEADLPAEVLFYPVGDEIRTAVLEQEAVAVMRLLWRSAPLHLQDLVDGINDMSRDEIREIIGDLMEIGLASLE